MPYFLALIVAVVWSAVLLWVILYVSAKYDENHNFFKLLALVAAPVLLPSALIWIPVKYVSLLVAVALSFIVTMPLFGWLSHKYCLLTWRRALIITAIFFVATAILNVAIEAVRQHTYPTAPNVVEEPPPSPVPAVSAAPTQRPPETPQVKRKLLPEERILVETMKWHNLRIAVGEQLAALRETLKTFPALELCGVTMNSVRQNDAESVVLQIRVRPQAGAEGTVEKFRAALNDAPAVAAIVEKVELQAAADPASKENGLFTIKCTYKTHYLPAVAAIADTGPLSVEELTLGFKTAQGMVLRSVNGNYNGVAADMVRSCVGGIKGLSLSETGVVSMAPVGGRCNVDAFAVRVSVQMSDADMDKLAGAIESGNPISRISDMSVQVMPGTQTRNVELTIQLPIWSSEVEANRLLDRADKLLKQLQATKTK